MESYSHLKPFIKKHSRMCLLKGHRIQEASCIVIIYADYGDKLIGKMNVSMIILLSLFLRMKSTLFVQKEGSIS